MALMAAQSVRSMLRRQAAHTLSLRGEQADARSVKEGWKTVAGLPGGRSADILVRTGA